jgi:hypothetical protein
MRIRIRIFDQWIRIRLKLWILLFSSVTFKMPTKNYFLFLSFYAYSFLKVIKKSQNSINQGFSSFLLDDGRIRIQFRTNKLGIRIQEVQQLTESMDLDTEHCFLNIFNIKICIIFPNYSGSEINHYGVHNTAFINIFYLPHPTKKENNAKTYGTHS